MKSYHAEELFDANGSLKLELAELAPKGARRMGANPHANGGMLLRDLRMPDFRDHAVQVPSPGAVTAQDTMVLGKFLRDVTLLNGDKRNFRIFGPDETLSNFSATSSKSPIGNGTPARSITTSSSLPMAASSTPNSASINAKDGWRAIC